MKYFGLKYQKSSKIAQIEKDYWKWHENSWNFWRKSTGFVEKCKSIKIWGMISIGLGKVSNLPTKLCAFRPKVKKNFHFFLFFDQNLYGKLTFPQFFTNYFLEFCLLSESIYPWKTRHDFYNNFSQRYWQM